MRPLLCATALVAWLVPQPARAVPPTPRADIAATDVDSPRLVAVDGLVLDPDGAGIPRARVTVMPHDPAVAELSTRADDQGWFSVRLPPGRFTLHFVAPGFADVMEDLEVPADAGPQAGRWMLPLAGVRETVTVHAEPGYQPLASASGTRRLTPLRDVPQSVTVVTRELMRDQLMTSLQDVVRYVPGITAHQGENNRDQVVIRGNNSSADFYLDGVRDDVQYYRDLYNLERVEALKGPNATMFGRGGGGGVINRVTKEALFAPIRDLTLQGGSFGGRRITADVGQGLTGRLAVRVNGMYEQADSFRRFVSLERYGINPTATVALGPRTSLAVAYEHLHDRRVADRGVPSYRGAPAAVAADAYFGNPDDSRVRAGVDLLSATLDHRAGAWRIRNRTLFGAYDRGYQNYVPGAVTTDGTQATLTAYNNATTRLNLFTQTDAVYTRAGRLRQTILVGAEGGRQLTDNFRQTGYFGGTATSILVPLSGPTTTTPVVFRQSATDADNRVRTLLGAAYAQEQIWLAPRVQAIAGLRLDLFDLRYRNNRTGDVLRRTDALVSPRAGIVVKPVEPLSIYGSYTVSFLPSAGDQFASLTTVTAQAAPERFTNYEAGAKWDLPVGLSVTAAAYRLDRTNTRATDPTDPTRIVQTGRQRTDGLEVGASGRLASRWQVAFGYAHQRAVVTSATTAATAGAEVAQVPRHTLSVWQKVQVQERIGVGLGVVARTRMFAAIDDTVVLPGYASVSAALYVALGARTSLQLNVDNTFNRRYIANADGNTNLSPGPPRSARVALVTRF